VIYHIDSDRLCIIMYGCCGMSSFIVKLVLSSIDMVHMMDLDD